MHLVLSVQAELSDEEGNEEQIYKALTLKNQDLLRRSWRNFRTKTE